MSHDIFFSRRITIFLIFYSHDRVVYKKIPLTESGFSSESESDEDLLN